MKNYSWRRCACQPWPWLKLGKTFAGRAGDRLTPAVFPNWKILAIAALLGVMACQASAPPVTEPKPRVFDVRQFGASGNGKDLDTAALQKALDACGQAGGGIVQLTAGTYLSKPIFLRNQTTLELETGAVLKGTDEPDDYNDHSNQAASGPFKSVVGLVNASELTNVAIVGSGTIDGSGARWWPAVKEAIKKKTPGTKTPQPRARPKLIVFFRCQGVRVQDVTLQNSPSFHLVPFDCDDVVIEHVTIRAPADSPNTDAIDPHICRHVRISHCTIDVGDDNIALKCGHARAGRPGCEDIVVSDCTFLHGHGVSIGSDTAGGVNGLTVERCTFLDTLNGIRIKSARGEGGLVENIIYRDLTMTNVKHPISISCDYHDIEARKEGTAQPVTELTPFYRNIVISNLVATSPLNAGLIAGLPERHLSDVVLENVSIDAPAGLTIRNADDIRLKNVKIETKKGEPLLLQNAQVQKF
jgi:polygalacturonase